ncbi:MAG TPA: Rcs stress response system protein RcsF [Pseudidiomarina sp.]|nr:Rcs stress response system protein RcsF [Pseudidiomarina sp.]
MSITRVVSSLVLILLMSGCQSAPTPRYTAAQLEQMESVTFVRPYELSRTDVSFAPLGEVRGESCQTSMMQASATEEAALLALKLAAVERGANALVLRQCQMLTTDACQSAWVCTGDAHQMQPLQ